MGKMSIKDGVKTISSPKRKTDESQSNESWYDFYAGFSESFIEELFEKLDIKPGDRVLDPWCGAGTTLRAGVGFCEVVGTDINPAMLVISLGRCVSPEEVNSLVGFAEKISARKEGLVSENDPLLNWLTYDTVDMIRYIQREVINRGISPERYITDIPVGSGDMLRIDAERAFLLCGLFKTVRDIFEPFIGSNPTWLKPPSEGDHVDTSHERIRNKFVSALKHQRDYIKATSPSDDAVSLHCCDSSNIPYRDSSFDAVIGSPPYCTRIDYAVATTPELNLLNFAPRNQNDLRRGFLGTPLMRPDFDTDSLSQELPGKVLQVLDDISSHESKDSSGYYFKFFGQYFVQLQSQIEELSRVADDGAMACLIVQTSQYKDIQVSLPDLFTSILDNYGWRKHAEKRFHNDRSIRDIHEGREKYNRDEEFESVLVCQLEG